MSVQLTPFTHPRPKVMVVSHERSGTHFLMNAIGRCFGYLSQPWINFDNQSIAANFHCNEALIDLFSQFRGFHMANIVKSHHPYAFFEDVFEQITQEFQVFYVVRDPRDVMVSLWRYVSKVAWNEGPVTENPKQFIRMPPEKNLLRYQCRQEPTMIHRWRTHVDSWTLGYPERLRSRINYVRFGDLLHDYRKVIDCIGRVLGTPTSYERPLLNESIMPHKGVVGGYLNHFDDEDLAMFREIAGPTMDRWGFGETTTAIPTTPCFSMGTEVPV